MSLIPCPNQIGCDSDLPLTNFSSENPDPKSFLGYSTGTAPTSSFTGGGGAGPQGGHGPDSNDTGSGVSLKSTGTGGDPPPLGSDYDNPTVTTFAESEESEDEANADAGNDNVSALAIDSTTGAPGGGYKIPPNGNPPTVYSNTVQSCTANCPDGSAFTFTVAPGKFRSFFSTAQANAAAFSYACRQAQLNQICLGDISSNACVGREYNQTIIASTPNLPVTFFVSSGSIPSWVTPDIGDDSVQFSGTPVEADVGTSSFTITAIDSRGNEVSRNYTIQTQICATCSIVESILPAFYQGHVYDNQLHVTGGTAPYTFSLVEGQLPTGLTLSTSGEIGGIAALVNGNLDQTFTVECTDSATPPNTCEKAITLPVFDYNSFPVGKHWRIQGYFNGMFPVPPGPFGCNCFGSGAPITVWDGNFNTGGGALFKSNQANGFGEVSMLTNTPNGVNVQLTRGPAEFGNHAWTITITCIGGASWVWAAIKVGSNQGAQLDSPAGTYTLITGAIGEPTICSSTASVVIEEY